jgi:hypothetical protein
MIFAVLATGPSMSQDIADSVRGRCRVVAVSDAYKLAPWADALASTDAAWWKHHKEALEFKGLKYGAFPDFRPVAGVQRLELSSETNSGLLGMHVAERLGASVILMLGFDLKGSHFFGQHPEPLKNTTEDRFKAIRKQFQHFRPRGVRIINCTPGSALECYEKGDLNACLAELEASAV